MNTQIDTNVPVIALLDLDAPAKVVVNLSGMAEPDFCENGRAYWIGTEAVVSCEVSVLDWMQEHPVHTCKDASEVADLGGWHARTGHFPSDYGFGVAALIDVDEAAKTAPLAKHKVEFTLWRMVQTTITADA